MLSCELSKPGLAVEWRKGKELLKSDFKYQIKNRNAIMELTIKNTQLEDSGLYSCIHGDVKTTADVTVTREGKLSILEKRMVRHCGHKFQYSLLINMAHREKTERWQQSAFLS